MVPARCKLAYIRADIIAIIGSAATGLISVEKVSNNPDEDSRIQEDVPEDLPPTPKIVRAPRASKISTNYNLLGFRIRKSRVNEPIDIDSVYIAKILNSYSMNNEVIKEELTMNAVPKAVNYLIEEVAEMRALLDKMEKQLGLGVNKHRPILIERAAEILHMKVGTVRRLVNEREIPHYKREHNIYFFEDELIKWIEESRVKTINYSSYLR